MESEEKKPKNIILDREIKQETDDYLKNVKEESMEKEEHFELIIPKQETQELLENFKEEPINEEYFDQILPKHEEVIEPSASYTSNNPMQKPFIETQEEVMKMEHHRCSVCLQICHRQNMRFVTLEEDRLVIIVGCVLRKSYTLEQARLFIRRAYYICCVHFSEAINKIHKFLKNTVDITLCSSELMDNLMITVNAIYPQVKTKQFCDIVYNFVRRNISLKQEPPNNEEQRKIQIRYSCSVCTHVQTSNNMNNVTMKDEKLVIMIGCILRGEYSLEQAHSFISQSEWPCICHIHFSQSVDEIHKALNIKQPDEVYSCSTELMANLMITVKKLDPWLKSSQFCHIFNKFVTRNMKLLDNTITPTGMELEKQKPNDTIPNEREIKQETGDFSENAKEESMEEKYFEKIVPKLEEIMEPSTSYLPPTNHLINPVQKFFMQTQKIFPTLDVEPQNMNIFFGVQTLRCSVCLQICPRRDMKKVRMEEDKLVVMVGCVLQNDFSLDQAQLFISESRIINICYVHFSETINKIFDVLNIKNTDEMSSCSSHLMNNLIVTFNTINPQLETSQCCGIIRSFIRRNVSRKRRHPNPIDEPNEEQQTYHCSVCTQNESSKKIKYVSLQDEKLVIMIGCILRGDYTLEQAHPFISSKKRTHICHVHFSEALNEIHKALNIKNTVEVYSCSNDLLVNLMVTVNELCPQLEICQFRTSLNKFFGKNRNFL